MLVTVVEMQVWECREISTSGFTTLDAKRSGLGGCLEMQSRLGWKTSTGCLSLLNTTANDHGRRLKIRYGQLCRLSETLDRCHTSSGDLFTPLLRPQMLKCCVQRSPVQISHLVTWRWRRRSVLRTNIRSPSDTIELGEDSADLPSIRLTLIVRRLEHRHTLRRRTRQ
jgi:hypothetical protein